MKDMVDFIEKVKPELDTDGYPKQSELCKRVESICINSLDQDIVEFFEVREEWNGVYIELGYDANLTVDKLHYYTIFYTLILIRVESFIVMHRYVISGLNHVSLILRSHLCFYS